MKPAPLWRDAVVILTLVTLGLFVGKALLFAFTRAM